MSEGQRRRISFGIILTVIGLPWFAASVASSARNPGGNQIMVLVGAIILAVGVYLIARFVAIRAANR